MEFFAGLVLNGVGIVFEALNVLAEAGVFVLKLLDLVLELLLLRTLAVPAGETMAAVDDAPGEGEGEGNGKDGTRRTPALLKPVNGSLTQR